MHYQHVACKAATGGENPGLVRQIKTVSFGQHEQDLLAFAERHGSFSPYIKRLLRRELGAAGQGRAHQSEIANPRLALLLGRLVALCIEMLHVLTGEPRANIRPRRRS